MADFNFPFTSLAEKDTIKAAQAVLGRRKINETFTTPDGSTGNLTFSDDVVVTQLPEPSAQDKAIAAITDALVKKGTITSSEKNQIDAGDNIPISSPLQLGTARAYWDFSDDSTIDRTGLNINSITDKSPNAFVLSQTTNGDRPTFVPNAQNGQSVAEFDGANSFLSGNIGTLTGAYTVVALVRFDQLNQPAGNLEYVMNLRNAAGTVSAMSVGRFDAAQPDVLYSFNGATSLTSEAIPGQQWVAISVTILDAAPWNKASINGVETPMQAGTGPADSNGDITVGRFIQSDNHWFDGRLAGLVILEELSADSQLQLFNFWKVKYAI